VDVNRRELIDAELRQASDRLRAARTLLADGLVPDAISRAYYATFHAAKAALAWKGLHAESHSGLKAIFGLHLVEKRIVEPRLGKILSALMEAREAADYDVWNPVDDGDARRCVDEASEFVDAIRRLVASEPP
jgi:uncharacterized protein (UPF0332 family)